MLLDEIKQRILKNVYVDRVRSEARIDEEAYNELCLNLSELAVALRGEPHIDKELCLHLYCIPMITRNMYWSALNAKSTLASKLENHWVDLDALVLECLSEPCPSEKEEDQAPDNP